MFDDFIELIGDLMQTIFAIVVVIFLLLCIFSGLDWLIITYGGESDVTSIKQETVQGKEIESVDSSSISANFSIKGMSVVEVTYKDAQGKKQNGYLLIHKGSEVAVDTFYSAYEGVSHKGIILNKE